MTAALEAMYQLVRTVLKGIFFTLKLSRTEKLPRSAFVPGMLGSSVFERTLG